MTLGFTGASSHQSIGEITRRVHRDHPNINLELHSSQFSHIGLQKVLDGSLDLAIGRWDYLPPETQSTTIGTEKLILAMSAGFIPDVVHIAPDSWTKIVLVGAEMGIAMTLDSVRENIVDRNVAFIPIREEGTDIEVKLIWKRSNESQTLHNVIAVARSVMQ